MTATNYDPDKLDDLVVHVPQGKLTTLQLAEALDGEEGKRLIVEHRDALPEEPELADRPRRAHDFFEPVGFAHYLNRYGGPNTVVYANPTAREVIAVLDELKEEGGTEEVRLVPTVHPRWAPWDGRLNRPMELDSFASFVRRNRRALASEEERRDLVLGLSQVTVSTEVTLHEGRGRGALNGLTVRSRINEGGTQSDLVQLPEELVVHSPLLCGTAFRAIRVDLVLSVASDGRKVVAELVSADAEEGMVEAFDELVSGVAANLELSDAIVAHGCPSYREWERLKGRRPS